MAFVPRGSSLLHGPSLHVEAEVKSCFGSDPVRARGGGEETATYTSCKAGVRGKRLVGNLFVWPPFKLLVLAVRMRVSLVQ